MPNYQYSFSGSDVRAFIYFDGLEQEIIPLESLHTVSFSVHEAKGQVRSLGYRGIRGLSRGVRTIAGSIIMTVVQDHPLREVMKISQQVRNLNSLGWSLDRDEVGTGTALSRFQFNNRLAVLLPPFNLIMTFVSELAGSTGADPTGTPLNIQGAIQLVRGVEILDEGQVTSVNDIVTEITYSFIARDLKALSPTSFDGDEVLSTLDPLADQRDKQSQLQTTLLGNDMSVPAWDTEDEGLSSSMQDFLRFSNGVQNTPPPF